MSISYPNHKIAIFTKDKPDWQGAGKSIRLWYWLYYLCTSYKKVYCFYFNTTNETSITHEIEFPGLEWIEIKAITPNNLFALWRRFIPFNPLRFNSTWFYTIPSRDKLKVESILNECNELLFFRLYLYPVLNIFLPQISSRTQIAIDLDDAENDIYDQILKAQWKSSFYKSWLLNRLDYFYIQYYNPLVQINVNKIYYSNPYDIKLLKTIYGGQKLIHFPNKVCKKPFIPKMETGTQTNILFTGVLNYFPNADALDLLINEIWPEILKECPYSKLVIVGKNPNKSLINHVKGKASISLIANPASTIEYFQNASVLIVPLRMGSGTRIKILEAFSFFLPVVSTSIGISGIHATHRQDAMIADTVSDLVQSVVMLIQSQKLRKEIAEKAFELFSREYSFDPGSVI